MLHADAFIEVDKDITLRRLTRENAQNKFDLIVKNHDHLLPWLPWAELYHDDIQVMYTFTDSEIEKFDNGVTFGYDIYFQDQLVGSIDLHDVSEENHRAEIGYWVGKEFTGKGIATRAAAALTDYAFKKLEMNRISIFACVDNIPSISVAKRLNFVEEGTLRQYSVLPDGTHDTIVFSKIKSEA